MSFRIADDLDIPEGQLEVELLQVLLLSAGVLFACAGVIVSAALGLTLPGLAVSSVFGLLYTGFLLITIVLMFLWSWVHPGITLPPSQQTLSESGGNGKDEEE